MANFQCFLSLKENVMGQLLFMDTGITSTKKKNLLSRGLRTESREKLHISDDNLQFLKSRKYRTYMSYVLLLFLKQQCSLG